MTDSKDELPIGSPERDPFTTGATSREAAIAAAMAARRAQDQENPA